MSSPNWLDKVRAELEGAEAARAAGNDGRARVCARRAASWAVKEFLGRQGIEFERVSGYGHINYLAGSDLVDEQTKEVLGHMTLSLAKDDPEGESYWPLDADLVDEAGWLVERLFPEVDLKQKGAE